MASRVTGDVAFAVKGEGMGATVCELPATLMPGQQVNRTSRAKATLWNIFASALVSHNLTLSLAICRGFASRLSPQAREGPAGCGVMLGCDFFLPEHFHLFLNSRVVA